MATLNKSLCLLTSALVGSSLLSIAQRPVPSPYSSDLKVNYVRTWESVAPSTEEGSFHGATPITKARMTTQYLDGLGRLLQTVHKGVSPQGKDLVIPVEYDAFGREQFKYLPYVAGSSNGTFKTSPFSEQATFMQGVYGSQGETYYYGQTHFEASPLNRPTETFAPGNSWVGTHGNTDPLQRRSNKTNYLVNTAQDAVRIWNVTDVGGGFGHYVTDATNGIYEPGQLYKTVTSDERGKQVVEYKDKEGKVVLKKVQLLELGEGLSEAHGGWLCTYYLYDDLGQLRAVVQPKGVETLQGNGWSLNETLLNEQCFRYEYDGRGRMIMKQVPGAAAVYMVYDVRDRLIFTQDGNMRKPGEEKWLATLYDAFNRPVLTGFIASPLSREDLQNQVTQKTTASAQASGNGLKTDLTLSGSNSGTHQALRSITLATVNGQDFVTPDGVEFTAEILTGTGAQNGSTSVVEGMEVNNNPLPEGASLYVLTQTSYDTYEGLPAPLSNTLVNSGYSSHFEAASNTTFPYAQEVVATAAVKGLVTWTKTRVLGTNDFIYTASLYDDKGRVVQVQTKNHTNGLDVATTQYDWSGKVLRTHLSQQLGSATPITVATKMNYDDGGRVTSIEKNLNNTGWKTTSELAYDALGQLQSKKLVPGYKGTESLETLRYDYNIRGWVLGMNRAFLETPNNEAARFGFELAYDKTTSKGYSNSYAEGQYNGNIAGMLWKSTGDKEARRYNFSYDNVNRLLKADFHQQDGTDWKNDKVNFTMQVGNDVNPALTAYDANGNIKRMKQWGLTLNSSKIIDEFTYHYKEGDLSNRLAAVTESEAIGDQNHKLGDFTDKNRVGDDYEYDVNGNLTVDRNKKIAGITYNHLNLPAVITVNKDDGTLKGTISYSYDAGGNKLKKVSHEPSTTVQHDGTSYTTSVTTTTTYVNEAVYESKQYGHAALASLNYTDKLQFLPHEEGRLRYKESDGSFAWDYFIKDHLGNVRMVLTDEVQPPAIYQATMEVGRRSTELALFTGITETESLKPNEPERRFDSDENNNTVSRLAGTSSPSDKRVGPALVLKVMAGDKIKAHAFSWYQPVVTDATKDPGLTSIVSSLVDAFTGNLTSNVYWESPDAVKTSGKVDNELNKFLQNPNLENQQDENVPKAYLNYLVLDEAQFKLVEGNYGATQINKTEVGQEKQVVQANYGGEITIKKNGYLYVYLSNESKGSVYFDQLHVTHQKGELLEETHYYPFGLTMQGISSKAAASVEIKRKYQQYELNNDFDINLYESFYRSHDPQVGRFRQIDPKPTDFESLYAAMGNNPISNTDFWGDSLKGNEDVINGYLNIINTGLKSSQADINNLNSRLNSATSRGEIRRLNRKLSTAKTKLSAFRTALKEFKQLSASRQVYNVVTNATHLSSSEQGKTVFNPKTGYIDVNVSINATNPTGTLAHELKHAYQFENLEVEQYYDGSGGGDMIDLHDELDAFQRGQLIDPTYYTGMVFTTQILQSSYPNNKVGPISGSSIYSANQTYEQAYRKDLFMRGQIGVKPNVIINGWQISYIIGVLTRVL